MNLDRFHAILMMMKRVSIFFAVAVWTAGAIAAPVVLDVDETQSTVKVELTVSGNRDDDTSRADGTIEISLDSYQTPTIITLHDFNLILLDDIDLKIEIFLGGLDVHGEDMVAFYATPGTPHPPVPLNGNNFTYHDPVIHV